MSFHEDLLTTILNAAMVAGLAFLCWLFARSEYSWSMIWKSSKTNTRESDVRHYLAYLVHSTLCGLFGLWYFSILIFGGPILVKWDISF